MYVWSRNRAILYHRLRYSGKSVGRRGWTTHLGGVTTRGWGSTGARVVVTYPDEQLVRITRLGLERGLEGLWLWGVFERLKCGFTYWFL